MKKSGLFLLAWLALAVCASAQVTVEVTLDQDQFLPNEAIPATVRITNLSGQTLHLGADDHWLTFDVESKEGFIVLKNGEAPVAGEFTLESSKRAIKQVDLEPYFNLTKPGRYTIIATVRVKDWDRDISSSPKAFDVIKGAKLWEQQIGVPRTAGDSNAPPEVRTYALQEANYLRSQLMLYFQLADSSGKLNKVFPIGPMLSFGQPEAQVDRESNLHVLYQNGPRSFNYTVINPDGNVLIRQTYRITPNRPRLKPDENGNLVVMGGTRQLSAGDLPKVEGN